MKRKEFLSTLINEKLSCKEENLSGIIKRINGDKKQKNSRPKTGVFLNNLIVEY